MNFKYIFLKLIFDYWLNSIRVYYYVCISNFYVWIYWCKYLYIIKRFVVKVDWKFLKFEEYEEGIDVEIFVDVKFF